eukprot:8642800-Prorocentrum_lima.AAC.1
MRGEYDCGGCWRSLRSRVALASSRHLARLGDGRSFVVCGVGVKCGMASLLNRGSEESAMS